MWHTQVVICLFIVDWLLDNNWFTIITKLWFSFLLVFILLVFFFFTWWFFLRWFFFLTFSIAFDVQPDEGSTLFYIQDRFPVPEDQSGATFEDGDMFALQLPASLARVSWSLPGNLESCTPMPYGVIASYEPNAFVVPVLPGGVTYVSYECTP